MMEAPVKEEAEVVDYASLERELARDSLTQVSTKLLPRPGQVDRTIITKSTFAGAIFKRLRVCEWLIGKMADHLEGYLSHEVYHQVLMQLSPDLEKAQKIAGDVYSLTANYSQDF